VEQFKVCTLCGALNVRENDECFVCRWSGEFDKDGLAVRIKINDIVRECPELLDVVRQATRPRPWDRALLGWRMLTTRVRALFRRRLDTRV
jgi:hypothetical protein